MIKYYYDLVQRSEEWFQARCGLLTASEMQLIITPGKLLAANNDKMRSHLYELAAQRVTKYVEPGYMSYDMVRGLNDEIDAKAYYRQHYAEIKDVGFVTNDKWGFTLGCSPDGLVGEEGGIQCKSRRQKFQFETIVSNKMPEEYLIQVQTELLVSERKWWDYVSYCGGMHMLTTRIFPDPIIHEAIINAADAFEDKMAQLMDAYDKAFASIHYRLIPTERKIEEEMRL